MNTPHFPRLALAVAVAAMISACGGGDGSSIEPASASSADAFVAGTAAYGAPMAAATVTVTDPTGQTVTVSADDLGDYSAKVTGFTAPLLVTATAAAGDAVLTYHAIADAAVLAGATIHANVTPLTEAIVAMASSDGRSPSEFDDTVKLAAIDYGRLSRASTAMRVTIRNITAALGDPGFDPLSSHFATDTASVGEQLLGAVKVAVGPAGVTLSTTAAAATGGDSTDSATVTIADVATDPAVALPAPANDGNKTIIVPCFAAAICRVQP